MLHIPIWVVVERPILISGLFGNGETVHLHYDFVRHLMQLMCNNVRISGSISQLAILSVIKCGGKKVSDGLDYLKAGYIHFLAAFCVFRFEFLPAVMTSLDSSNSVSNSCVVFDYDSHRPVLQQFLSMVRRSMMLTVRLYCRWLHQIIGVFHNFSIWRVGQSLFSSFRWSLPGGWSLHCPTWHFSPFSGVSSTM